MVLTKDDIETLKENFHTKKEIEDMLKSKGVTDEEKIKMAQEFVDHLNQCKGDDCEIHKAKNKIEDDAIILGMLLGKEI